MKEKNTNKQWEFDDTENQPQESKKDNQDIFSAENWFVEGKQSPETPIAEKQSWEDYIVTEDEVVIPVVANAEDNQPTVKDNENKEVSATAKPKESKNKKSSKKSLIISLCAIAVTLSIVLGVIFIPDWDDDIPIDTDIPFEEQVDDYISTDGDTDFSDGEEVVSGEGSINSDEESDDTQTEESTTKKNSSKETTTKNNSASNNERPTLPNVKGMKEAKAIELLKTYSDEIYEYYYYTSDVAKGCAISCRYGFSDGLEVELAISMGSGKSAWSGWQDGLPDWYNVEMMYCQAVGIESGWGNGYEAFYVGENIYEIDVTCMARTRKVYKDSDNNIVKTEAWSNWYERKNGSPGFYEEYCSYYEAADLTVYEQLEQKYIHRWRYFYNDLDVYGYDAGFPGIVV